MSATPSASVRLGFDSWGLSGALYHTGMGQYAANLLRELPQIAPEFSLFAYGAPDEPRPSWLPAAVQWRSVGRRLPAKLSALYSWTLPLRRVARADGLDLFHAPAVHMRPFFPPVPRLHCPVVATLHDLIPMTYYELATLPRRQRLFYRWNVRRAATSDALVTVSEHSRSEISRVLALAPERIHVIHNGVDFQPNRDPGAIERLGIQRPFILYAGGHEPRKNLTGALSAFALLARAGYPHELVAIVDAGSGHESESLATLRRSGLADRVRFVHGLSDADLRALYTGASVLLFPSLAEGFGLPPVQAGACGVPIVASDLPVLREVLDDCALYVDPRSDRSIADGLARVLDDADLRTRLARRGPELAARYSSREAARKHAELYQSVVASWASESRRAKREARTTRGAVPR